MEDLKNEVTKLCYEMERVQYSVDVAINNGKHIHAEVNHWLQSVAEMVAKARDLLDEGERAKNARFLRWLPNPMVRQPFGRKMKKMTQVIQGLHEQSRFQEVSNEPTQINVTSYPTAARFVDKEDILESRASITMDVIKALVDDEIRVIGVYGPGGVGKTKILADVTGRVNEDKLFDVIVMVHVSHNPDLKCIQGEIAYGLRLKLTNDEPARARADRICKRLESSFDQKILIILDDLWDKLELKEVGIPCGDDNRVIGCKLLLSSRCREVLRIDMGSDLDIRLNELNHGEARRLFEMIVGDRVTAPEFEPLVDGVVQNCGGLPLLIVSSAKKLKHGNLATWWNDLTNIEVSTIDTIVKLSFNDLKEERIRSLFLVCALASGRILMRDALVYCMGLGLFERFNKTIENVRHRLMFDLHSLQDSSLFLESDDKKHFGMNDIFVEAAIAISTSEWKALVGRKDYGLEKWSKDELKYCTALSFPFVGIDELPEKLDCPNLRILLLFEDNPSLKIPESFFESTRKLRVLDISGPSFTSLPSSIELLENLISLCLDSCHLEDVTVLGKLKGLQFLSFLNSTITRLPKEIGGLTALRFLDLTGCTGLKVIEPGVLGSLVNLEELFMEDSFDQWEAEDEASRSNASLAELKNMKNLSTLYIVIPQSANLLRDLTVGKLNKYKIQIGDVQDWSGEYHESRTLKLNLDSGNLLLEEWAQRCLRRTQYLHLDGLQDDNDFHDLNAEGFQELKHLYVQNSPSLRYIVHSTKNVQCNAFTELESIFLENLDNLEKICFSCLASKSFSKLKIVKVSNCGEIKYLFPLFTMRTFLQLEEIEISSCYLMQQILMDVEVDEDRDEIDDDPKVKSCNLRRLTLQNLPEMTSFCKTMDHSIIFFDGLQVLFPSLEELTLLSCGLRRIWHNGLPEESFRRLASITVGDCENLSHIFPSALLERFQSLKMIEVVRCTSLEALVERVAIDTKEKKKLLVLSDLKEMKLWLLPRLSAVLTSSTRATLVLPSMTKISLHCCDSLRYFFTNDTARTLDKLEMLDVSGCNNMQEVVAMEEGEEQNLKAMKFTHLRSLKLCSLKSLISFSSGSCAYEFPSLRNFSILECSKLKAFILRPLAPREEMTNDGAATFDESPCSLFDKKVIFPKIEELRLTGMQSREFWENEMQDESICFHNLTYVRVGNCPHLRNLFTISMAKNLGHLQYLGLGGCGEMEYIVAKEEEKPREAVDKIVIHQLVTLSLHNMAKLRSFCYGKHISEWPSLKEFTVEDCKAVEVILGDANHRKLEGQVPMQQPLLLVEKVEFPSMESLKILHMDNLKKIWLDELASNAFSKLKTLTVEHCEKLSSIFSSGTILARFQNLEKLTVINCDSLEVIFNVQEFNSIETHSTSNFLLRELVLTRLPKMMHVWGGLPNGAVNYGRLRCLKAIKCQSLKSLFPMPVAKTMTQLEELGVWYCGLEEIMVEGDEGVETSVCDFFFPRLTALTLVGLSELRSFYRNSHTSTWLFLKELRVRHCGKTRSFSFASEIQSWQGTVNSQNQSALFSLEKVIPHLEQLTFAREDVVMMQHDISGNLREFVVDSSSFEEIFQEDVHGLGRATPFGELTDMQRSLKALGNLKRLRLINPFNLRRVWEDGSIMAEIIKQIESLFISRCPNLLIVFQSPTSFQRLIELEVVDCNGLVHMGTCSALTSMEHLTRLTLRDCGAMEDVVTDDGNGVEISFPMLEELILDGLPSLESFSPVNCIFMFPSLVRIIVMQCPKMKIFCNGFLETPKLDKVLLSYREDEGRWEDDLNTTVQNLSARKNPSRTQ